MVVVLQFNEVDNQYITIIGDNNGTVPADTSVLDVVKVVTDTGNEMFIDARVFNNMIESNSYPLKVHVTLLDNCIISYCLRCVN